MKWIKASEDLPIDGKKNPVYFKGYRRPKFGLLYKEFDKAQNEYFTHFATEGGVILTSFRNRHEGLADLFWLDITANTQSPVIDEIVIAAKELNDACDEMWNTPDIKGKVPDHIVRIITKAQKKLYQIISNQLK